MFARTLLRSVAGRGAAAAAAAGLTGATALASAAACDRGSGPVTRIIRFTASDGNVYLGEEPAPGATEAELLSGDLYDPSSLRRTGDRKHVSGLLAPVVPSAIFCIGLNYMKHYEESAKKRGIALPDKPVIFMKPNSALNHPGGDVWLPGSIQYGEQVRRLCADRFGAADRSGISPLQVRARGGWPRPDQGCQSR